jgi:uncharacterized protein YndB with AHSA1/START domain
MITIKTEIQKPIQEVWETYINPEDMNNWNNASPDWACKNSQIDLREGGQFASIMYAKDGSAEFTFGGEYLKIIEHSSITSVLGDGRKMNVYFRSLDPSHTEMQIDFDAETQNSEEFQKQGWLAILENFAKYCSRKD